MKILNRKIIVLLVSVVIISISCSSGQIKPVSVKRNFSGALWIVRDNISTPEKIDSLIGMIANTDIKHLMVQVRGRGDSYYNSDIEPRAVDVPEGFDPLLYLLKKISETDIKVHAWVNVSFVLDPGKYPPREKHILGIHPEWITYDHSGKPMSKYTPKELKNNLLEGYFVDPAVPGVKEHIAGIVTDILAKYPVHGIHLDYIRYPYSGYNQYARKYLCDFGYNPVARKIFKKRYGVDPIKINRFRQSLMKSRFDKFRQDQVTGIVKKINTIVKSKDPNLILSAAVMPRYDWGKNVYFQDWPMWLEKNYIDLACVMSYSQSIEGFENYVSYANNTRNSDRIIMGISVTEKTKLAKAVRQIGISYESGMRGFSIFSFTHKKDFIKELDSLIQYNKNNYKY